MKKTMLRLGILLSAILLLTSCPQPIVPAKSTDATLGSLSVVGYAINTAFSANVTSYHTVVEKTVTKVGIIVASTNSNASLAWDKNPSDTVLSSGPNVFTVTVTAEDGTTRKSYALTVYKANASVEVIDSVNGSKVATGGTISVYSGGNLLYGVALGANPQQLWLGSSGVYTVKASPTGRAQSSKENITGSDNLKLTMICQKLGMSSFPAESPLIDSIAYTTAADPASLSTVWTAVASGSSVDFSTITYIKLVATGKSEMESTSWSGFGIMMGLDLAPSDFMAYVPPDSSHSSSSYNATTGSFTGTAYFDISGLPIMGGSHTLSFVIYDRANNRVERNLVVTNTLVNSSGADISADYFQSLLADLRIYGVSREYFGKKASTDSLTSLPSGSISYRAAISFMFQTASSGGSAVPILGYTVYRSEDFGVSWTAVGTVNYGAFSTGWSGTHTFYDTDSQLTTDLAYKYKVTVFTDNIHTKTSDVTGLVHFLPPFTVSLSGPANKSTAIDSANLPNFEFTISDPRLWSSSVADGFYFSPVIRNVDGTNVYIGYLYYQFSTGQLQFWYPAGPYWVAEASVTSLLSFDSATGKVSLDPRIFNALTNCATGADVALESGLTYYWDIFGNYTGNDTTNTAAYFQKSGTNSLSRSYADVYQNGQETLNGWFSFTVK